MSEPRTAAGRRLHRLFAEGSVGPSSTLFLTHILDIESETRRQFLDEVRCDYDCDACTDPDARDAQRPAVRGPIFDAEGTLIPEDDGG